MDTAALVSGFSHQPTRTRRLYCAILSRLPQQTEATRKVLLQALHDREDGVRWQAALAMGATNRHDAQCESALLESLNDTNELVGAAAVCSLARLKATNAAPLLFAKLKIRLQSTNTSPEELQRQVSAVTKDLRSDIHRGDAYQLLDPDHLGMHFSRRVPDRVKQMSAMRLPPQPFSLPTHDYTVTDALIGALGDLDYQPAADELFKLRGTDYDAEVTRALNKLAPDRLTNELLATAKDKQVDSYVREQALVTLCSLSATNRVRDLVPLLDDTTPIVYSRPLPGPEWRICDRAVATITVLLGWENRMMPMYIPAEQREDRVKRVREWANQSP